MDFNSNYIQVCMRTISIMHHCLMYILSVKPYLSFVWTGIHTGWKCVTPISVNCTMTQRECLYIDHDVMPVKFGHHQSCGWQYPATTSTDIQI